MDRFRRLDLNLLRTFEAVYVERNLSRAAKLMGVTQPAVSNSLTRLRASLGDQLFVRERRGMMPTPFADSIAPAVHSALELVRDGLNASVQFNPATSIRRFRVSMNDPAEMLFLRPLIERFVADAPGISVFCSYVGRHEMANEMAAGAIDVAIEIALPMDERLHHAALVEETYVCLLPRGHPLAGQSSIALEQYLALDHVHVSARRSGQGHVDRALAEISATRKIRARLRNVGLAAEIVRTSNMSMTMPARFADYYGLDAVALPFDVPRLQWQLYWPARLERDLGNIWLRDQIRAIAARLGREKA